MVHKTWKNGITITSIFLFLICITGICCCLLAKDNSTQTGSSQKVENKLPQFASEPVILDDRFLQITTITDMESGFTTIKSEDLGGSFQGDIVYLNLRDVNIDANGEQLKLEDALRDGIITAEEIFAYARLDARYGFCTETFESKHGLTHFTYCYPEFNLRLTYDVYETPDNQQHLINEIIFYSPTSQVSTNYTDDKTGDAIDREDWGLTFEAVSATSTILTVECSHSGGQQIGNLLVDYYIIYRGNDYAFVPHREGIDSTEDFLPKIIIPQNEVSVFAIDWTETYGMLDSGEYSIALFVHDEFDKTKIHPLMEDYYDTQRYWVEFSIP